MSTRDETSPRPRGYPGALRTTVRNNSSAYGYSLAITVAFGLINVVQGTPSIPAVFAFLLGSVVGFAAVEALASKGFRRPQPPPEQEEVVVMSGAVDLLSVLASAGAATGAAHAPGLLAWALGGLAATVTFLLVGGVDVLIARRAEERDSRPGNRS